jgi:hypothetical protein
LGFLVSAEKAPPGKINIVHVLLKGIVPWVQLFNDRKGASRRLLCPHYSAEK